MKKYSINILLLLLICLPSQLYAEVYKWVDERGQTHYGEKPPVANADEIKIKGTPDVDDSVLKRNEESDKLLKVFEEERNIKNEENMKAAEEQRKLREKCVIAENEIKDMQQEGMAYYDLDEKGERKFLSDAELALRIKKLQEQYNQQCK